MSFFSQTLWTSSEAETSAEAAPAEKKEEAPAAEEKQAE
jgi:14-3-3 protein epsilon